MLDLWMDSSDTSSFVTSGSPVRVDSWTDKAHRGVVLAQTGSARPHYTGSINGITVPLFQGSPQFLSVQDVIGHAGFGEVWAVVKWNTISVSSVLSMYESVNFNAPGMDWGLQFSSDKPKLQWFDLVTGTDILDGSTALSAGTVYLLRWSSKGSTCEFYVDGVLETITPQAGANSGNWLGNLTTAPDRISIGCRSRRNGNTEFFDGELAELKAYVCPLGDGQAASLTSKLSDKWNLGL